jgi:methylmalonyl-CoA/ethylmalonyl-CoA epimerase
MTGVTGVTGNIGVTRIGQIAFTVSDLAGAVTFYRDVLGLRFLFEAPPNLAFFECGGTRLMLTPPEREGAFAGQQFNSILYYTVADIQAAASALSARGVEFEQPPHIVARLAAADVWIASFRDPDGHPLALISEVPRA